MAAFSFHDYISAAQNSRGGVMMNTERKKIIQAYSKQGIPDLTAPEQIVTDPNGSYTGRPKDPEEKPIQDADDL